MRPAMMAITARPPITPPTMAPTLVDEPLLLFPPFPPPPPLELDEPEVDEEPEEFEVEEELEDLLVAELPPEVVARCI